MLPQLRNKGAEFGHPGSQTKERTWKSDGGVPKEAITSLGREPESRELASCLRPRGLPTPQQDTPLCTTTLSAERCPAHAP